MPPLDWSRKLPDSEYETIMAGYRSLMGDADVGDIFKFVPVLSRHDPAAMKRYRLWINAVTMGVGLDAGLPNPPVASLIMGHYYATIPYPEGLIGDLLVVQQVGGCKQEALDILALASLHAGPHGMNVAARALGPHLDRWEEDGDGIPWPDGWAVSPETFRSGVDLGDGREATAAIAAEEIDAILQWHLAWQGGVPPHVEFLAEEHPTALLVSRARTEDATTRPLPAEYIALCQLHLAASWGAEGSLERAMYLCRRLGVTRDHVVQVLALSTLYTGEAGSSVLDTARSFLGEGWPEN